MIMQPSQRNRQSGVLVLLRGVLSDELPPVGPGQYAVGVTAIIPPSQNY